MNWKELFRGILLGVPLSILLIFSFETDRTLQIILAMALPVVMYIVFNKINNTDKKLYFGAVTLVLFLATALNSILTQNYSLNYILPSFGGVLISLLYVYNWEKGRVVLESSNLIKEGKFEETLPYLDKLLELDPQSFYALYNKALTFNEMGKYTKSIELTDEILKKDQKNDFVLNLKANSLIELEKYDEALEHSVFGVAKLKNFADSYNY